MDTIHHNTVTADTATHPKPIIRTATAAFLRFTVRLDTQLLPVLRRIRKLRNYPSLDRTLSELIGEQLKALDQRDEELTKDQAYYRRKTAVAKWKHVYLSAVQLNLYRTLLHFDNGDSIASAEGRVFCACNVELAEIIPDMTSQMVRDHLLALVKKGLITRVFLRNVEAPDGRNIREQFVYVIHAHPDDVVVL